MNSDSFVFYLKYFSRFSIFKDIFYHIAYMRHQIIITYETLIKFIVLQDCHYWSSAALRDRYSWWKPSAKGGLVKFGEEGGEGRMWQLKYFLLGRSVHGSERQRYIRQSCCVTTTFWDSLLLIIKVI